MRFLIVLLVLMVLNLNVAAAQTDTPIVAVSNNSLYAVSPTDGSVRLLVERSAEADEALRGIRVNPTLRLSALSPDHSSIAYIAPIDEILEPLYRNQLQQITQIQPNDIYLVDIAKGEQTAVTKQAENLAQASANGMFRVHDYPTWSYDGQRLYYEVETRYLIEQPPTHTIEYYDVATGETETLATLPRNPIIVGLYAVPEGLLALNVLSNSGLFEFTLYGPDGETLHQMQTTITDYLGYTNNTMIRMNPIQSDGSYGFGLFGFETGDAVPGIIDLLTGENMPLDDALLPAFISRANPETSLRVALANFLPEDGPTWMVTDPAGEIVTALPIESIAGMYRIALSPDGQAVAYSNLGTIFIEDANGIREFELADVNDIEWGPVDFAFAPIIYRG